MSCVNVSVTWVGGRDWVGGGVNVSVAWEGVLLVVGVRLFVGGILTWHLSVLRKHQ